MDVTKTCPKKSKRKVPPIAKQRSRLIFGGHFRMDNVENLISE
jgi:hypothetical protein